MWAMLGLGLLVCVVSLFRCLPLPLFSLAFFLIVVWLLGVCFPWVVVGYAFDCPLWLSGR